MQTTKERTKLTWSKPTLRRLPLTDDVLRTLASGLGSTKLEQLRQAAAKIQ